MKIASATCLVILSTSASLAAPTDKFNITPQEHAACDADTTNLCASSYPDEGAMVECMKAKRGQLSSACAIVLKAGLQRRHMQP